MIRAAPLSPERNAAKAIFLERDMRSAHLTQLGSIISADTAGRGIFICVYNASFRFRWAEGVSYIIRGVPKIRIRRGGQPDGLCS